MTAWLFQRSSTYPFTSRQPTDLWPSTPTEFIPTHQCNFTTSLNLCPVSVFHELFSYCWNILHQLSFLNILLDLLCSYCGMGAAISRLAKRFIPKCEMRIVMVGLDASGKTTILYKLKLGEIVTAIPTVGNYLKKLFTLINVLFLSFCV